MKRFLITLFILLALPFMVSFASVDALVKYKHPHADTTEIHPYDTTFVDSFILDTIIVADTVIENLILVDTTYEYIFVLTDTILDSTMISERGTILLIKPTGFPWGGQASPPHYIIVQIEGVDIDTIDVNKFEGRTVNPTTMLNAKNKIDNNIGNLDIRTDVFLCNGLTVSKKRRLVIDWTQLKGKLLPKRYYSTQESE